MENEKFNVIDLFAGCGGLLEGFKRVGNFNTVACVEWEPAPVLNLVKRLKEKWGYEDAERRVLRFDIQRTAELFHGWEDDPEYGTSCGLDQLVAESGEVDLVIGGPPCQAYSLAGRIRDENGMRDDYRNYLFESYLEVVKRYRPKMIVFENVEGMLSACPGDIPVPDLIRSAFDEAGYQLVDDFRANALLDLTQFGVPQKRKRVILMGLNRETFGIDSIGMVNKFYNSVLPRLRSEPRTVKDAIGDLPKIYPVTPYKINGKQFSHAPCETKVNNHTPRFHNPRDIEIFRELAYDIQTGSNKYKTTAALKELYTAKTGKVSNVHKYYVLRLDEASNTIPAHLYKDGLRHIHPDSKQARSITVREAARLQTFPDDYQFVGSMGDQYKMIGNAVPPQFSYCLAKAIKEVLLLLDQ